MDQGDAEDLIQLSRAQLGYAESKKRFPRKETLHYVYSRHINTGKAGDDLLRDEYSQFVDYHQDFVRIFADYTRRKGERNLVDYDDLPGTAQRVQEYVDAGATHLILNLRYPYPDGIVARLAEEVVPRVKPR